MIADAFFSFLNWLRLLFFNREMELALIGANCVGFLRGKVFVLYSLSLLLLLLLLQKPKTRAVRGALAGRSSLLRSRLNERARERGEICSRNTCFLVWFPNKFSDRFLFLSFV
jgi:hypothetical protein